MKRPLRIHPVVLLALLTAGLAPAAAWRIPVSQSEPLLLAPGASVEREIGGEQKHSYAINLTAGQLVEASIQQKGIDLMATLLGPDGTVLDEFSEPVYETTAYKLRHRQHPGDQWNRPYGNRLCPDCRRLTRSLFG